MTTEGQLPLFGAAGDSPPGGAGHGVTLEDAAARAFAIDPANNVVLEASAGTGKTSVLVSRYVTLLHSGVDPSNILAITFTRQAAAEMRDRIIRELRTAAGRSRADRSGASARAAACRAGGVAALSGVRPTWADGARGLSTGGNTVGGRGGRGRRGLDPFPGRRTP